jgi:hypothetical protein
MVGPFIAPQENLSIGGVRDPNMSALGAGHVWPRCLEPGLGTKQVRFRDLTWVKAERLNMSGLGVGHVWDNSLEPG